MPKTSECNRIRWWKIREEEFSTKFRQEISLRVNWECASWHNVANAIRETAGEVLGMTMGKSWRIRKHGGGTIKYKKQ